MTEFWTALVDAVMFVFELSVFGYNLWGLFARFLGVAVGLGFMASVIFGIYFVAYVAIKRISPESAETMHHSVRDALHDAIHDTSLGQGLRTILSAIARATGAALSAIGLIVSVSIEYLLLVVMWPFKRIESIFLPISKRQQADRLANLERELEEKRQNHDARIRYLKAKEEIRQKQKDLRRMERREIKMQPELPAPSDSEKPKNND